MGHVRTHALQKRSEKTFASVPKAEITILITAVVASETKNVLAEPAMRC